MSFLLVHGASFGANCWEPLLPLLSHDAHAIDLPGRGARAGVALETLTLSMFAEAVRDDILEKDLHDVVLIGHSLAGVTLPRVINLVPDRIRHVVLVSAVVPPKGTRVIDQIDPGVRVMVEAAIASGIYSQTRDAARLILCNDMNEEQSNWPLDRMVNDSAAVLAEVVDLSGYSQPVPRSYVFLGEDDCYVPELQRRSAEAIDAEIFEIDCGHMAMVTRPAELAGILNGIHG